MAQNKLCAVARVGVLAKHGMTRTVIDPCLFVLNTTAFVVKAGTHVDDFIFTTNDAKSFAEWFAEVSTELKISQLSFPRPTLVHASPNNPGAAEAAAELASNFVSLRLTDASATNTARQGATPPACITWNAYMYTGNSIYVHVYVYQHIRTCIRAPACARPRAD